MKFGLKLLSDDKLGALENYQRIAKTPEFLAWKKSRR